MVVSRVAWDQVVLPASTGLYGGGGFDMRGMMTPMFAGILTPGWGAGWKQRVRETLSRRIFAYGHSTQLPVATNRIDLDPDVKDAWGLPAPRLTFTLHPNDVAVNAWFLERAKELLIASGGSEIQPAPFEAGYGGPHLLGTCRMGNDPGDVRDRCESPHARCAELVHCGRL